jgi:hypothetical protein
VGEFGGDAGSSAATVTTPVRSADSSTSRQGLVEPAAGEMAGRSPKM